jgi:molybdopterin-guanine dinucleotide biosynthesis protein A
MTSPLLLVLAVDLPEMSAELLRRLSAGAADSFGAIPKLADGIEPLAAFYPKTALPLLAKLCEVPERQSSDRPAKPKPADSEISSPSVKQFAELCVQSGLAGFVELGDTDTSYFANWNSPADLVSTTREAALHHET